MASTQPHPSRPPSWPNAYVGSIHPFQDFEWLRDIPWADACAVVQAVVHLEAARLTKSGGSASAIKNAYRTMEDSDRVGAMELAAWIVDHSDNDYIPFPMCKTRHAFEGIKRTATSWAQCREELDRANAAEWVRQSRVAAEIGQKHFQGDSPSQRGVPRLEHDTHSALAQHADDLVFADPRRNAFGRRRRTLAEPFDR